jgi:hypothetical protein
MRLEGFPSLLLAGYMYVHAYIHVDRFAICIFNRWVISFNEDSLDELRCSDTLLLGSAFAKNWECEEEIDAYRSKHFFPRLQIQELLCCTLCVG